MDQTAIESIQRRDITEYLRYVKENKGKNGAPATARNRNNYLTELNALFEKMIEEEMTTKNPCRGIVKLKETVNRHVAYSEKELKLIGQWMDTNEPYLKCFTLFIGYAFLRPSEILGLKVGDIKDDHIYLRGTKAKTRSLEVVPIISLLKPAVDKLVATAINQNHYLFSPSKKPGPKPVGGTQYFSKRFGRCKAELSRQFGLNFNQNHTLYAMRHTFIRNIYQHYLRSMTQHEAEFKTMLITRHRTVDALRKYIRDFRIHLPGDWSAAYSLEF
jgi:integrase